jgi:molybdate transport repressor ModE-like protein
MAINLNQLRVFQAVCEAGSITAAARSLRISQPAASKQLAELETSLGVPLVDRLPRGIRATAVGTVLSRHARRLFQEEKDAERALANLLGLERGRLAVGASTTIGNYLVPQLFGTLHKKHPNVTLELEIGNTAQIQQQLLEGRLDVGLTEGRVGADALEIAVFAHDEMVLIVAPNHPLLSSRERGAGVSNRQLERLPFVVRERGSGTRDVVEDALRRRGLSLKPVMSLGSTEAVKNAVANGLGAAIVSRLTVELELSSGRLAALPVGDLSIQRALHLLTLEGKQQSPACREFLRVLHERHPPPASDRGSQGTSSTPRV